MDEIQHAAYNIVKVMSDDTIEKGFYSQIEMVIFGKWSLVPFAWSLNLQNSSGIKIDPKFKLIDIYKVHFFVCSINRIQRSIVWGTILIRNIKQARESRVFNPFTLVLFYESFQYRYLHIVFYSLSTA